MSDNLKYVLGMSGLLVVTIVLTSLTIWSFAKPKSNDDDEDDEKHLFI